MTSTRLLVLVLIAGVWLRAQQPTPAIVRLDPALDPIVSPTAVVEPLKTDYFGFLEGPVWVHDAQGGHLLLSDVAANLIYKWRPDGQLSVFLDQAGYRGTDNSTVGAEGFNGRLHIILLGPNGLALDPQGRVVVATHGGRSIVRVEADGSRTTLADRFEGRRLNSPNDLLVTSTGAIYFTDPTGGLRGRDKSPARELPFAGVYLLRNETLRLLVENPQGAAPNGIALSPDEKYLYVNGGRKITRYEIQPDGAIANGRLFIDMTADKAPGGTDGMKVDRQGNVYCTGPGGVWIMSAEGRHLGTIVLPELPANLAFGDPDGQGLYLAARRGLYRIRMNIPGIRPARAR